MSSLTSPRSPRHPLMAPLSSLLTPVLVFVLPAVLLLFHCSILTVSQRLDYTQLSIASVTSVDGFCINSATTVTNCYLPASLAVRVSGIPSSPLSAPPSYFFFLFVTVDGASLWAYGYSSVNDSSLFQLTLSYNGYDPKSFGVPMTVCVFDYQTGNTSQSLAGLSIAYVPPPSFTAISGCIGSGAATVRCLPDSDTLMFTGTGLSLFSSLRDFLLIVGNVSGVIDSGWTVLNDSALLIPLSTAYGEVLQEFHFTDIPFALSFNLRGYNTDTSRYTNYIVTTGLTISFAPLPPPTFTSLSAEGSSVTCSGAFNTSTTWTNCVPQLGFLFLNGDYLYNVVVTLTSAGYEGYACSVRRNTGIRMSMTLPIIPGDVSGNVWSLTVTTSAGSFTIPNVLVFTTTPTITSVVQCGAPYAYPITIGCLPSQVLTVRGVNFPSDPAVMLTFFPYSRLLPPVNFSCPQTAVVDANTITCIVPTLNTTVGALFWGQTNYVQAVFPTANQSTTPYSGLLLSFPDSPLIATVVGCEQTVGNLTLVGCRSGEVVTVSGSNLNSTGLQVRLIAFDSGSPHLTVVPGWSSSSMQLMLPFLDPGNSAVQEGVAYPISWEQLRSTGRAYGNAFYVAYTYEPPIASQTNPTPSSNAAAIAAGVLVPVLVIALAAVAWLSWRRWRVMGGTKVDDGLVSSTVNHERFIDVEMN